MAHPLNNPVAGGRLPAPPWSWQAFFGISRIEPLERYGAACARILLSQIFLLAGIMKLADWSGTEAFMASRGMVLIPLMLLGAVIIEVGGGLALFLGYKGRLAAFVLFLFLIPTTLIFHNFWTYPPEQQAIQSAMFMKNLAIMGGLLSFVSFGPGLCSLDAREVSANRAF